MITIFAASEYTTLLSELNRLVRCEFYSTSEMARMAIAQWANNGWIKGEEWQWSTQNERWERLVGDVIHVLVVKEHVVHDTLQKDISIEPYFPVIDFPYFPSFPDYPSHCLHDNCIECGGSGVKKNGAACIHWLSCFCPKCSPSYIAQNPYQYLA